MAVVEGTAGRWRVAAVAASYQQFALLPRTIAGANEKPVGSCINVDALLEAASKLCAASVDVTAIDMPLARNQIVGRRTSDDKVSRLYGARKCGTHSPTSSSPGAYSLEVREAFERAGYPLCTTTSPSHCLIEVYPHPALVELTGSSERVPYKVAKARKYWPDCVPDDRVKRLLKQWHDILETLETELEGAKAILTTPSLSDRRWRLKAFEDQLDAIVCAWVGVCAIEGRASPFGDEESAIWIPANERAPP